MADSAIKIDVTYYYVEDIQKAEDIYARFLGVQPVYANEDWARYEIAAGAVALHYLPDIKEVVEIKQERGGTLSFTVSDIQSTLSRAKESGFRQVGDVDEESFGKLASLRDPWDNHISLIEPASEE